MLIVERSVTRAYWEWTYRKLTRHYREGSYRNVGGVVMLHGAGKGHRIYYAVFHDTPKGPRPVAWLMLYQRIGWWAWEVEQLWVFPKARGRGLAKSLYKAAINQDGLLLASGKTHTKHSKALWESFIKKDTFNIWAHDFRHLDQTGSVVWDEGEIFCRLKLYEPGNKAVNDVRLLALRKTT